MDNQKCPDCGSGNLNLLGKTHITRKERNLLITNYGTEEAKRLYYFSAPRLELKLHQNQTHFIIM